MLEPILKGLVEWIYEMMIDIMAYASSELLGVMSMDLSYFERTAPIISDIVDVFVALGWALLIGNLVFQSIKIMMSGAGFEAEDPKTLFLRTFAFSFLLLTSREICDMCSSMAGTVITLLDLPDAITVTTPDESMFSLGSGAKWLLVIIVGVVLMVQMVKLLFEIGERYVITSVLTFFAPLAFAMGGSKNTNDIFKGWCRMYGSMLIMMIMNIVFLKLIMSAMSSMSSGGVLIWLVFVVALTRVARKIDSHIGKIGLNPAQTGNELGSHIPGAMTMMAVKVMSSAVGKSMANAKGTAGRNGSPGGGRSGGHRGGGTRNNGGNRNGSNYRNGANNGGHNTNYNSGGNNSSYTSGGQNVHNGYSGNNANVNNAGNTSYGKNSNVNNGNVNSNTSHNGGKGNTHNQYGTKNGSGQNSRNNQNRSATMQGQRRNGGTNVPGHNGDVNVHGTAATERPNQMHRPNGMQGNVSHYTSSRGGNTNSANINGKSSYHTGTNGINANYSLNKGQYKGTASGQNLHAIKSAVQNNPARMRPVIPRDTSGSNPSGANVMGNVVKSSQQSSTMNMGNSNASVHNAGNRNAHNHNMGVPPRQGTNIPNMRQSGGNTNIGGAVHQNSGRNVNVNNGGHSDTQMRGSTNVSGGVRGVNTNVGGNRNSVHNAPHQGNVHNTGSVNSQSNQRTDIGGSRGYTQSGSKNIMSGQRVSNTKVGGDTGGNHTHVQTNNGVNAGGGHTNVQVNGNVNVGGNNSHIQNSGMNVTQNNSGNVHNQSNYSGNHSFTENFDGKRFEQHVREVQNDRYHMRGINNFTNQQQINHEYRQGKYNPASVNKKVSKSYYRKENLQERFNEHSGRRNMRGGGNNRKPKR